MVILGSLDGDFGSLASDTDTILHTTSSRDSLDGGSDTEEDSPLIRSTSVMSDAMSLQSFGFKPRSDQQLEESNARLAGDPRVGPRVFFADNKELPLYSVHIIDVVDIEDSDEDDNTVTEI